MADRLPMPPPESEVSADGREIWEWAGAFSREVHRRHQMRELSARIARIGTRCGHCEFWMKKSLCPREKSTMTGYNSGPSSEAPKCAKFSETSQATELRKLLNADLSEIAKGAPQRAPEDQTNG